MTKKSLAGLAYVRFVLEHLQLSPTGLARRAGVSSSTLTRMLNDPNYKFTLSLSTLDKIEAATGLAYTPFFVTEDNLEDRQAALRSLQGVKDFVADIENMGMTPILGSVAPGVWYELGRPELSILRFLPIKVARSQGQKKAHFAVSVDGNSLERFAKHGDFLICERLDADVEKYLDSIVIVERKSEDGKLVEVTARVLTRDHKYWRFSYASDDEAFARPLIVSLVEAVDGADSQVRVTAVVRYAFRHLAPMGDAFAH